MATQSVSKTCSVGGCRGIYHARGCCRTHYTRLLKHGSPLGKHPKYIVGENPAERLWNNVNKNGPTMPHMASACWEWKGPIDPVTHRYGEMKVNGKDVKVHRLSWSLAHGSMPTFHILHACDNPPCVNPDHLREGTPADNTRDKVSRRRHRFGENHHPAKLTNAQVLEIRRRLANGEGVRPLAREYGLNSGTVSSIKTRRTWQHLP